jgi:hypothetical protein
MTNWLNIRLTFGGDLRFSRWWLWRMVSSGLLRRVDLVITDVSEEPSASFISVTRIGELGTTLAATSNWRTLRRNTKCVRRLLVAASVVHISPILVTLMKEALGSSETSVLTRATWRNIPEDTILQLSVMFSRRCLWRMPSSGIEKHSLYLTGNILRVYYRAQPVNSM